MLSFKCRLLVVKLKIYVSKFTYFMIFFFNRGKLDSKIKSISYSNLKVETAIKEKASDLRKYIRGNLPSRSPREILF